MTRVYESIVPPGAATETRTDMSTGKVTVTSGYSSNPTDFYRFSRSDIVKQKKDASGWRAPTPYTASLDSWAQPTGGYTTNLWPYLIVRKGCSYPEMKLAASLPTFPSGLRSRAEVNALTKLKDQKVNLSQALGERKQTIRLVADNLMAVAKMRRNLMKTAKREWEAGFGRLGTVGKQKFPTYLADRWLELQYGWKPLLSDIYGTVSLIDAAEQREGPRRYRISVMGKVREDSKTTRDYSGPGSNRSWSARETTRVMHGCKVKLYYEPSDAAPFQSLAQSGVTNPAELAWELLPWSFVVDWALPIGAWLSVLDADIGWKFLSGTRSQLTRVRQRTSYHRGAAPYSVEGHGRQSAQRLSLNRVVLSSTPFPTFPRFKDPRSAAHLANALALLASAFGRGSSKVRY